MGPILQPPTEHHHHRHHLHHAEPARPHLPHSCLRRPRHVVPSAALTAQDVPVGSTDVKTAGGEEITVTRNKYIKVKSSAGEAGVVAFDVLATNGVVHLVDTVF